ncbi:MAG TPA: hypothetical protein VE912_05515 [Bacteroidales bacterium]|nr:hypothetical protein [Bacteroidales bacterium]
MKTTKSILTSLALFVLISVSAAAQSEAKVIAVINEATWCPVCQKNGERAMAAFKSNNKDGAVKFLANDVSNKETKKKSSETLKKYGLEQAMASRQATGVAYFFDAGSGKLINQVSLAKSDQVLADAMTAARKEAK